MPPVSEKQRKAMHAAAAGHSTLGIPKKVGEEFVGKDEEPHAAGLVFVTPDNQALFVKRSKRGDHEGTWAFPGGMMEEDETPEQAALREAGEEIGAQDYATPLEEIARNGGYVTYMQHVQSPFSPVLNNEHTGYAWAPIDDPPLPLHPGVAETLEGWGGSAGGDAGGANDARPLAFDRSIGAYRDRVGIVFALDRAESLRSFDKDGRMRVALANISKAAINPYRGREIPGYDELGLDPDKIYQLLRDPDELRKAAPTFAHVPILDEHVPVSADDHQPDIVLGSTGSETTYKHPYLQTPLVFWTKRAIADIQSEDKKELSSAYHYRADMTPGTYEGQHYDGVMRDIVGNHVALVKEGRAGSDVVVGDSTKELHTMPGKTIVLTRKAAMVMGALVGFLKPKLAADAKLDWAPILGTVTHKNFAAKIPAMVAELKKQTAGKLAKDASIDEVTDLLQAISGTETAEAGTKDALVTDPDTGIPAAAKEKDDGEEERIRVALAKEKGVARDNEELSDFLKAKGMTDEDIAMVIEMAKAMSEPTAEKTEPPVLDAADEDDDDKKDDKDDDTAKDEPPPFKGKPEVGGGKADMTKKAMDAAIATAVEKAVKRVRDEAKSSTASAIKTASDAALKNAREIREAENHVRPYVGTLAMAHDSAEAVYRTTFDALGIADKIKDVDPSAFKAILDFQPVPGTKAKVNSIAHDSAGAKSFAERNPGAAAIEVL